MNSREYQNLLHIVGTLHSVLLILGAVIVGSGDFIFGIILMLAGATFARMSSEIEFRKMGMLIEEKK